MLGALEPEYAAGPRSSRADSAAEVRQAEAREPAEQYHPRLLIDAERAQAVVVKRLLLVEGFASDGGRGRWLEDRGA